MTVNSATAITCQLYHRLRPWKPFTMLQNDPKKGETWNKSYPQWNGRKSAAKLLNAVRGAASTKRPPNFLLSAKGEFRIFGDFD